MILYNSDIIDSSERRVSSDSSDINKSRDSSDSIDTLNCENKLWDGRRRKLCQTNISCTIFFFYEEKLFLTKNIWETNLKQKDVDTKN